MSEMRNNPITMDQEYNPEGVKRKNWTSFIESDVVNFFDAHEIEKLTIEDGTGNKAKLVRTKDNQIKVEYTSSVVL